eukprot:maker-scaffold722_size106786-snap-gene-0.30 protein:Tk04295 transcript:maker-scaffold722_size106786-snap-gene-0.30-mRNA-1 annotation:"receptor-mediated endocytosis protein 6 homolog"
MSSAFRGHRSSASVKSDLLELSRHLRQERLYVQNEKEQLQELNQKVKWAGEKLAHKAWVAHQQRENLDDLILPPRHGQARSPASCCQRAHLLEQTEFQDAYKQLNHQEILYSEFLHGLRERPKLLAVGLTVGDKLAYPAMAEAISTVFSGLYGSCLMEEDEQLVLQLLHHLLHLQLTSAVNPRKMLRQGHCAFSRLYKSFTEELFSAKIFLTSALYDPILRLLTEDEMFLDIDPSKAVIRFPPSERLKKFGPEGSPAFGHKLKEHREFIIGKLATLTNAFIEGIRSNLHCFPPSLARLLRTVFSLLMASGRAEPREVNAVCVDLVFDLFICPAMVDPNPVGIIDTPISYIARSNLMQVAQILQVLSLWKWEEIDPRLMDLYSRFDKECMSSVIEAMLEAGEMSEEAQEISEMAGASRMDFTTEGNRLSRLALLMTRSQLEGLIAFLKNLRQEARQGLDLGPDLDLSEVNSLIASLPETLPAQPNGAHFKARASAQPAKGDDSFISSEMLRAKKHTLSARLSTAVNTVSNVSRQAVIGAPRRVDSLGTNEDPTLSSPNSSVNLSNEEDLGLLNRNPEMVMVIPLLDSASAEPPGFLTEEHVLTRSRQASRVVRMNLANLPGGSGSDPVEEGSSFISGVAGEKRTRFSLSHDEGSIGNTSDNLEAVSEAASNHSMDSSLEDEVDQAEDPIIDNLSDMVSANVSGRGTPNVSGRDTPSSQVTNDDEMGGGREDEDDPGNGGPGQGHGHHEGGHPVAAVVLGPARGGNFNPRPVRVRPAMGSAGRKNGEPDLEEKFGRFEIKPPPRASHSNSGGGGPFSEQGDETRSMVSDTWSTDVLGSDTETTTGDGERSGILGDLYELSRNRLLDELAVPPTSAGSLSNASSNLLDIAETASEAWSMDVLASDSESLRLGELDNEDAASVARSDDTRFTDDTTRSDPEPMLDVSGSSGGKFRMKDDIAGGLKTAHLLKPSREAAVEQWARQSSAGRGGTPVTSTSGGFLPRRGSDSSGIVFEAGKGSRKSHSGTDGSILKKSHSTQARVSAVMVGPSTSEDSTEAVANLSSHLSATSIASSCESSGDSGEGKSRSNSNAASHPPGTSSGITVQPSLLDTDNPPIFTQARGTPTSATGAIPKSISFDKTVYDADAYEGDHAKGGGKRGDRSFFRSLKMPKIGRNRGGASSGLGGHGGPLVSRSGSIKSDEYLRSSERLTSDDAFNIPEHEEGPVLRRVASYETSDDILAKYRKKVTTQGDSVPDPRASVEVMDGSGELIMPEEQDERLIIDPANIEVSYAFQDAKRKLRLMLSEADLTTLSSLPTNSMKKVDGRVNGGPNHTHQPQHPAQYENEIVWFLRVQLAESHNLQDRSRIAQLHETLRCVELFDSEGCRKLVRSLRDDYKRRSPYLNYLLRCRQGLLSTLAHQQTLLKRMEGEERICSQYLVSVCIRLFLERREKLMQQFLFQFKEINVSDERIALMERFLGNLSSQLDEDPSWALVANEEQNILARITIERAVVSQIFIHAMYPNGEADISRDEVLSQHIRRLSEVITPNHKDLRIPRHYQYEQPWPSAQAEIRRLAAYKTPSDKVGCVTRCSLTIMNLLALSSNKSVPAADDFVPVMVFVLIKANPASLLSTIQYVDSYYGDRMKGEDQYWWMQFAAAIEFIKTMDYQLQIDDFKLTTASRIIAALIRLLPLLLANQIRVDAAGFLEGCVRAQLLDPALGHHRNGIGLSDGAQAMSNDQDRATLGHLVDGFLQVHLEVNGKPWKGGDWIETYLNHLLRFGIQGTGGLVEDEDGWILEESTSNGDPLLLPPAHRHPALPQDCVVLLRESPDEVVSVGGLGGLDDLVVLGRGTTIADVLHDRGGEENWLLIDVPNGTAPQPLGVQLPDIHPVHGDHPRRALVESLQ